LIALCRMPSSLFPYTTLFRSDYKVDVNGNEFTLTFDEDFVVDERYVVEFTTTVPDISQENYKNDAKVIVDGKEYPYSGSVNYDRSEEHTSELQSRFDLVCRHL